MHHINLLTPNPALQMARVYHERRRTFIREFGVSIDPLPIDRPRAIDRTNDVLAGLRDWRTRTSRNIAEWNAVNRRAPGTRRA
jgi:hypothetical protein